MFTQKKQNLKKLTYFCLALSSIIFSSGSQANEDVDNEISAITHTKIKNSNFRKDRLELFGLDKFDSSFKLTGILLDQVKERNKIWKKPNLYAKVEDEIIKCPINQDNLLNYIPYYLKEILEIRSANSLKHKEEYFSDFLELISITFKSLNNAKQKKLNDKLSLINLEDYEMSSIFLRYISLQKTKISNLPFYIKERITPLLTDEMFNKHDDYKYHQSLANAYKKDQTTLEELSSLEEASPEMVKNILSLYNIINN